MRALKFARYLPAYGWRPLVVAGAGPYHVRDESLAAEIPPEAVVRWATPAGPAATPLPYVRRGRGARWRARLARRFRPAAFSDAYAAFAGPARAAAEELRAAAAPRLIFSTAPPFTSHVVAAELARAWRVPLVLDYRDAWTTNPFERGPTPAYRRRARELEAGVVAGAAAVCCVTEGMAADYRALAAPATAVSYLPNGFDEADFARAAPAAPREGPFTITYAGQLYGRRMPWTFFAAAAAWARQVGLSRSAVRVRLLGPIGPGVLTRARRFGVEVEAPGVVGHCAAVQAMGDTDVNLLLIGAAAGAAATLTGKIFEYLRAGRPILALVPPDGEAGALIRRFDAGVVVAPEDRDGAAAALAAFYARRGEPARAPAPELAAYERSRLTAQLARLFDDVTC